jgi:hypothetical protein
VRNLVFYSGIKTVDLIGDDQIKNFLTQPHKALLIAPAAEIDRLERDHGVRLPRLAELRYFNEAGVRARTLLAPDPERDLTRVLLVANR